VARINLSCNPKDVYSHAFPNVQCATLLEEMKHPLRNVYVMLLVLVCCNMGASGEPSSGAGSALTPADADADCTDPSLDVHTLQ